MVRIFVNVKPDVESPQCILNYTSSETDQWASFPKTRDWLFTISSRWREVGDSRFIKVRGQIKAKRWPITEQFSQKKYRLCAHWRSTYFSSNPAEPISWNRWQKFSHENIYVFHFHKNSIQLWPNRTSSEVDLNHSSAKLCLAEQKSTSWLIE